MKKTLYVSDLDGTLLRSNQTTSKYTNSVINELTSQGTVFSYATARSIFTAKVVTAGMEAKFPVIAYNGAFIVDNKSYEIMDAKYLDEDIYELLKEMFEHGIYPIVYAIVDGKERFSVCMNNTSQAIRDFVKIRNDIRKREVETPEDLLVGDIYYITCIYDADMIEPFYNRYKDKYHCVFQKDIYSDEQWLEIMSPDATKAKAIERLKEIAGCDYVVAFGDGINDKEMFEIADEAYAMENAVEELKKIATAVIGSNDEDGVAKWLDKNVVIR